MIIRRPDPNHAKTQQARYHPGEPHDRIRGSGGQGDCPYARRPGGIRRVCRSGGRRGRAPGQEEESMARRHDHPHRQALPPAPGAVLQPFRRVRRLPLAAPPLRDPARRQAAPGLRPTDPHRPPGGSGVLPHPGLGQDRPLPQQTRVLRLGQALALPRGDRRGDRRRARPRIPCGQVLRQGTGHRPLLPAARTDQRHPSLHQALVPGARCHLLQYPGEPRPAAQHVRPHDGRGRGDADRLLRRGFPAARSPAGCRRGRLSADQFPILRDQREEERHHRRPPLHSLPWRRSHLRDDGGAALQDRPQVLLPDQYRPGLQALQGRARIRRPDGHGDGLRPLHRHGHHRPVRVRARRARTRGSTPPATASPTANSSPET